MDMKNTYIENCPICGGALQATEVWHVYKNVHKVAVNNGHNGGIWLDVVDDEPGYNDDEHLDKVRIYCENDHSEGEMLANFAMTSKEDK